MQTETKKHITPKYEIGQVIILAMDTFPLYIREVKVEEILINHSGIYYTLSNITEKVPEISERLFASEKDFYNEVIKSIEINTGEEYKVCKHKQKPK